MSASPDPNVAQALQAVRDRIAAAAHACGRSAQDVTLVAVSKTQPVETLQAAIAAGQVVFGENRVQEAAQKFGPLRAGFPQIRLHVIGGLQTNKALDAVRLADVIETLDRPKLADAIDAAAQRAGRLPTLLVQVNVGDEPQKSGVPTGQADAFIEACRQRFADALQGVMCVPPEGLPPEPFFTTLAALRHRHGLPVLSMGMSQDFETAIRLGATHVRVGSAIFGRRPLAHGDAAVQHGHLQQALQPL